MSPGEKERRKRKRERERAAYEAKTAELRRHGSSCGNCSHRGRHSLFGAICDLKSDWEGYVRVDMDHLCPAHELKRGEHGG